MELIFNVNYFNATMAELDYDANKMPLGKLSKKTLLKGYEVLKELASLVADPTLASTMGEDHREAVTERSNQYFSLVPHVVGRRSVPVLNGLDSIRVCGSRFSSHWVNHR
jgi:poly [ADP-ribose] polymerase